MGRAPTPSTDSARRSRELLPAAATGSYDVRAVASLIVDDGSLLELRERWAPNVVTALATIGGRPIGIVANQPLALAGTLDIAASQKAARFVSFCDAFNIGILTLVDTPGFYPGKDLEWRGMIRHGAQLVFAYARATVPRLCVILRKSYGGAYIVMDSKRMGNDVCFAWPSAELAVMGAGQAAAILRRRATPEERRRLRGRLRRTAAQPVHRRRTRLRRRRHRPCRDPAGGRRGVRRARRQARAAATSQTRQRAVLTALRRSLGARLARRAAAHGDAGSPCGGSRDDRTLRARFGEEAPDNVKREGSTCPTPSRSPTTAPARR